MSANAIPPEDWRVISAGVSDPNVLARLRMAYTLGGYRCKRLVLEAIAPITMPDAAPIAVLVPEAPLETPLGGKTGTEAEVEEVG